MPTPIITPASTPTTTAASAPNDGGMVFDNAPISQPLTVPNTLYGPSSSPSGDDGMVFDNAPLQQPLAVPATTSPAAPQPPVQPATGLQRAVASLQGDDDPEGSWYPFVGAEMAGALKSAASGLGGIVDLINNPRGQLQRPPDPESIRASIALYRQIHPQASADEATAFIQNEINAGRMPMSKTLTDLSSWLHSGGQPEGFWQNVGGIGEQALEWVGGEGLLKLASAPAKAAQTAKTVDTVGHIASAGNIGKVLAENPRLAGIVTLGLKASKDALAAGAQNYLHYEDTHQAVKTGVIGGALSGAIRAGAISVSKGLQAIRAATDSGAVQDALQGTVRTVLGNTADALNVPRPSSPSMRDVFDELSNSVAGKAQALYRQIDNALTTEGGTIATNYKTYDQQIANVRREIRMSAGIDPDADGKLLQREAALVDAKQKAIVLPYLPEVKPLVEDFLECGPQLNLSIVVLSLALCHWINTVCQELAGFQVPIPRLLQAHIGILSKRHQL